jgi:hypothetical protein
MKKKDKKPFRHKFGLKGMNRKEILIQWLKKMGWAGFFFFLIKGVTLYIVLPYLITKGLINCS